MPRARFVMCRPEYFEVNYAINARMQPQVWAENREVLHPRCLDEWDGLVATLRSLDAGVELIDPVKGLPDMVFTANSAVVLDGRALLSRFRYDERRDEEQYYSEYYSSLLRAGVLREVRVMAPDAILEGHGDAVWDATRGLFWFGFGPRSSPAGGRELKRFFDAEVVPLQLSGTNFYHLDTALAVLPRGEILFAPQAFAPQALEELQRRVPHDALIEAPVADAEALAVNLIALGEDLVVPECSPELERTLRQRGYNVRRTPLTTFALGAGGAFCLSLRLDHARTATSVGSNRM